MRKKSQKWIFFVALSLGCILATAQPKAKAMTMSGAQIAKADTTPVISFKPMKEPQFLLVMNEGQLQELYSFIKNADLWSDKGREQYLTRLDRMVTVIPPAPADTAKKK